MRTTIDPIATLAVTTSRRRRTDVPLAPRRHARIPPIFAAGLAHQAARHRDLLLNIDAAARIGRARPGRGRLETLPTSEAHDSARDETKGGRGCESTCLGFRRRKGDPGHPHLRRTTRPEKSAAAGLRRASAFRAAIMKGIL